MPGLQLIVSHGPNTDQYVGVRVVSLATTTTTVFLGLLSRFNGIYAFIAWFVVYVR